MRVGKPKAKVERSIKSFVKIKIMSAMQPENTTHLQDICDLCLSFLFPIEMRKSLAIYANQSPTWPDRNRNKNRGKKKLVCPKINMSLFFVVFWSFLYLVVSSLAANEFIIY